MDPARFTLATGNLVRIDFPRKDWAFVPSGMPPRWDFDPSLWPLVAEARDALGTLNGIGQTLKDPELLLRPLQSREAISSSNIEGTFVTPEQLLLYGLDPREPRTGDEQMADWYEVFNYNRALQRGCELLNEMPLCNRLIKEMHSHLMKGVRGRSKGPGEFRKWQVQIGSSGRFIPPPALDAERLMADLEKHINADDTAYDPLVSAYLVHYQFEAIHPFGDGNGRVGRLLLALMIYKSFSHSMPWLYMSPFFEQYKDEYVQLLFNVSARAEWSAWIEFCLRGTIVQAKDSIRRCHEFNRLLGTFHERVDSPSSRTHPIIDSLFTNPVVTITSIAARFDVSYMTAKADLERLAKVGILKETGAERPKAFYSPEIMSIAYGEPTGEPSNHDFFGVADIKSSSVQSLPHGESV